MVMFRGLKASFKKTNKVKNRKSQPDLYLVKTADDLLSTENNLALIKTIKSLLKPSDRFNFYLPIIKKFAEFVQEIPFIQYGFFDQEIKFLERGLERSARTLSLCLKIFFPEATNFINITNSEALSVYAAFTAALFLDVGKLGAKYSVMLYDDKLYQIKKWNPFAASMLKLGYYYKIDYLKENYDKLEFSITPMLARQILDSASNLSETEGFNWITSDLKILEIWFYLLSGEEDRIPMTSFMSMVPCAEIELIENSSLISQNTVTDSKEKAFLQWLREGLANGEILINKKDAKIIVADGKVFISTAIFQEFANRDPKLHPEVIEKIFIDIAEKEYQINIKKLKLPNRTFGLWSDLSNQSQTLGGIPITQEKNSLWLQGNMRLISLITSNISIHKMINSDPTVNVIKNFISPFS